jgi:hypothetical protein
MIAIFAISSLLVLFLFPLPFVLFKKDRTGFIGATALLLSQMAIMALCILELFTKPSP